MTLKEKIEEHKKVWLVTDDVCIVYIEEEELNKELEKCYEVREKLKTQKEVLEVLNEEFGEGYFYCVFGDGVIKAELKCRSREGKVGVEVEIPKHFKDKIKRANTNLDAIEVTIEAVEERITLFTKMKKLWGVK